MEPSEGMTSRQYLLVSIICLALLIPAAALDGPIASAVRSSELEWGVRKDPLMKWMTHIAKAPGDFRTWIIPAAALCLWHRMRLQAGGFLCLANIMGLFTDLLKWIIGRTRPFRLPGEVLAPFVLAPFHNGLHGLIKQSDLSFPSGHSTTAFASAAAMAIMMPRWRVAFYAIAALVAVERVVENAHYLSDTIAGAWLSIVGVHLLWLLCKTIVHSHQAKTRQASVTLNAAS